MLTVGNTGFQTMALFLISLLFMCLCVCVSCIVWTSEIIDIYLLNFSSAIKVVMTKKVPDIKKHSNRTVVSKINMCNCVFIVQNML